MRILLFMILAGFAAAPAFAIECLTPRGEVATFPMASCPFGLTPKAGAGASTQAPITTARPPAAAIRTPISPAAAAQPLAPDANKPTRAEAEEAARQRTEQAQRAQTEARARAQAATRAQAPIPQTAAVTEIDAAAAALSQALAARRAPDAPR